MNTTTENPTSPLCLPARAGFDAPGRFLVTGGVAGSYLRTMRRAPRSYREESAERAARLATVVRDAGLVLAREALPAALLTVALAEVGAASSEWQVWQVVRAALAEGCAARRVLAAKPAARWSVAVRWTREGKGGVVAHAQRAARVMRAAGVKPREATQKLAREAIERAGEVSEARETRRRAAARTARRALPLNVRFAAGIASEALPAAYAARLRDFRRAFVAAFRWPDNAAQKGARCSALLADRGRVDQKTSSEWTKYSSREGSHQTTTTSACVLVTPAALARESLWTVDGVVTLALRVVEARRDGSTVYAGTFARQGRGVDIVTEEGFLAVAGDGTAVHGTTARGALAALSRRRNEAAAAAAARTERAQESAAFARVRAELAAAVGLAPVGIEGLRRAQLEALAAGMERPVSLAASIAAGNCEVGTRAWAARNFPSVDPATGAVTVRAVLRAGWSGDLAERATRAALAACVRAN